MSGWLVDTPARGELVDGSDSLRRSVLLEGGADAVRIGV